LARWYKIGREIVVPFQYSLLTLTDFKFEKHVPWDSPDIKFFQKGGVPRVTFPYIFGRYKG